MALSRVGGGSGDGGWVDAALSCLHEMVVDGGGQVTRRSREPEVVVEIVGG